MADPALLSVLERIATALERIATDPEKPRAKPKRKRRQPPEPKPNDDTVPDMLAQRRAAEALRRIGRG